MAEKAIYVCDLCGREISRFEGGLCNRCEQWIEETRQAIFSISGDILDVKFNYDVYHGLNMLVLLTHYAQEEKIAEKIKQQLYGKVSSYSITTLNIILQKQSLVDITFESNFPEIEAALEADSVEGEE